MVRNCLFLEQVSVHYAKNLVDLRVVGLSIALKYLEIKNCGDITRIQIHDASLVSLAYTGHPIEFDLSNVPLLIEVSLCYSRAFDNYIGFDHLSCCLNQLQTLMLDIPTFGQVHHASLPVLPNLKSFQVRVCADAWRAIPMLTSYMKAFPNLERLVLKLECCFPREDEKMLIRKWECSSPFTREGEKIHKGHDDDIETETCPYRNIKVLEFLGYRRLSGALDLLSYIVKKVAALDKIIIDRARSWVSHGTKADKRIEEINLEEDARDHAMNFIKKELPPTVEFVCL